MAAPISEHFPILLRQGLFTISIQPKRFRFENAWLEEKDLMDVIQRGWSHGNEGDIVSRLLGYSNHLVNWSKGDELNLKMKLCSAEANLKIYKTEEMMWVSDHFVRLRTAWLSC